MFCFVYCLFVCLFFKFVFCLFVCLFVIIINRRINRAAVTHLDLPQSLTCGVLKNVTCSCVIVRGSCMPRERNTLFVQAPAVTITLRQVKMPLLEYTCVQRKSKTIIRRLHKRTYATFHTSYVKFTIKLLRVHCSPDQFCHCLCTFLKLTH